ncbi:MAG: FG-GAP repeat protein [Candidatus Sulfotelmatobacter sp.]
MHYKVGGRTSLAISVPMMLVFCGLFSALAVGRSAPIPAESARLSPEAQSSISAAMGEDIPAYQAKAKRGAVTADNARQKLAANFTVHGVEVRSGRQYWTMVLQSYGYGDTLRSVIAAAPKASLNRVEYRRGELTEWYLNGPFGLEQGITLQKQPGRADGQPLTVAFAMESNLAAAVDENGKGLTLTRGDGQMAFHYRGLLAYDENGKKLQAWLELKASQLLLRVEDASARYPVVIDPFVQTGELTASDGVPNAEFGDSVAVSGNTVVAGAPGCLNCGFIGAAYVFTEPANGWGNMTQTAKLTASDGVANNQFGFAVSIDGGTIAVGAHGSNSGRGAVYIFNEPAIGWTNMTQTAKLTASDATLSELVGRSVSISGNTVVAGAPQDNNGAYKEQGAAYVFVEPADGWADMTQTAKLTPSDGVSYGEMGYSVGVDGNTVVAGDPSPISTRTASAGKAYVFVEPLGGWGNMTQTAELTGSDATVGARLGNYVAISGNTVVAGAPLATPGTRPQQGAAYVFVEPVTGWANMTQTAKLTASDGVRTAYFGRAVAISGNEIVIGAPNQTVNSDAGEGAVYEFLEPETGWANMTQSTELNAIHAGDNDQVGCRVSVDGGTVVAGALGGSKRGAVFVFTDTQ